MHVTAREMAGPYGRVHRRPVVAQPVDVDLHARKLMGRMQHDGPDIAADVEHHRAVAARLQRVLVPVIGVHHVLASARAGMLNPLCGVPRYGNDVRYFTVPSAVWSIGSVVNPSDTAVAA